MEDLRLELEGFAEQQRLKDAALRTARAGVADLKQKLSEAAVLEEEKEQKEKLCGRQKQPGRRSRVTLRR